MAGRLCGAAILRVHSLGAVPPYNQDFDEDVAPTAVRELKFAIRKADGIVLCSPEYNYGMSGVLKNAIDWVSRPAMNCVFKGKPVLLMSCSPSAVGGARAHAQMRETLSACLAWVIARPQVVIASAKQKILHGQLVDRDTLATIDEAARDLLAHIQMQRRLKVPNMPPTGHIGLS
jgi:chromate reductase